MSLRFYNTRTRTVEPFSPQVPGKVKLYTCGPTVYDYLHIGNWAAYIYWDILVRVLQADGLEVDRVMNITDVGHLVSDADEGEDKLEKGARREGKTAWDVAKFYGDYFLNHLDTLNIVRPSHITKATDYIDQQLELVRTLKEKGHTYQTSDGIYFDTTTFPTYADFARLDLSKLKEGARVEANNEKRSPSDFALWKFTPEGQTRDMQWPTPADITDDNTEKPGFPGWHLECSAMSMSILGDTLDIHTGGIDHIPVHHTNEIAQSEAASGKRFCNTWLHNNHLKVDGTKISKSLGNGYRLEDITEKGFNGQDLRMFILQSSYRNEGNFTFDNLEAAAQRLKNWKRAASLRHQTYKTVEVRSGNIPSYAAQKYLSEILHNDLNTPEALAHIDKVFNEVLESPLHEINRLALTGFVQQIDSLLGFTLENDTPDITDRQKQLIVERRRARDNKDWPTSDQIRDELSEQGIFIRDTARYSIWERR
ncbi:cysteine--tRNA ligase [Candidatus Saccharibacteria bacterium]|jgi:cysteinyl-tRNA synthetase|nr:cysteine--tRNA ligase [Candidatus Saccharibacteria bacterium]